MWLSTFEKRLDSWVDLRSRSTQLPLEQALEQINNWWFDSPWTAYHLHWDDRHEWPDPWELLSDNLYCEVARGLGIMYTIAIIDRKDISDAVLTQTNQHNLVLIEQGKYMLNYERDIILNKNFKAEKNKNYLTLSQVRKKIK